MTKNISKKTIQVKAILDYANDILANGFESAEYREAIILMLENVLRSSGNYCGFNYLTDEQVPVNRLPGIREFNGERWNFVNTDNTRRYYSPHFNISGRI